MMAADVQEVTLLAMLDLSAEFDCVDHTILLQRLQVGAGLTDIVLQWISSFLSERTQQVAYNGKLSTVQLVLFGVPQGSVLGPLLYMLYTAEVKCTSLRQPTTPPSLLPVSPTPSPTSTTG